MDCRQENKSRRSITGQQAQQLSLTQSPSTGPGAVYPSHMLTLTTTEEPQLRLTADQRLCGNMALLVLVNNPSVNPEATRLDAGGEYIQCVQVILSTQNTCILKAGNIWKHFCKSYTSDTKTHMHAFAFWPTEDAQKHEPSERRQGK